VKEKFTKVVPIFVIIKAFTRFVEKYSNTTMSITYLMKPDPIPIKM
jgi:hypothetical protein